MFACLLTYLINNFKLFYFKQFVLTSAPETSNSLAICGCPVKTAKCNGDCRMSFCISKKHGCGDNVINSKIIFWDKPWIMAIWSCL